MCRFYGECCIYRFPHTQKHMCTVAKNVYIYKKSEINIHRRIIIQEKQSFSNPNTNIITCMNRILEGLCAELSYKEMKSLYFTKLRSTLNMKAAAHNVCFLANLVGSCSVHSIHSLVELKKNWPCFCQVEAVVTWFKWNSSQQEK